MRRSSRTARNDERSSRLHQAAFITLHTALPGAALAAAAWQHGPHPAGTALQMLHAASTLLAASAGLLLCGALAAAASSSRS